MGAVTLHGAAVDAGARSTAESAARSEPIRHTPWIGLRYRAALWPWLSAEHEDVPVDVVEIDVADAGRGGDAWLRTLAGRYRLVLHDASLSVAASASIPAPTLERLTTLATLTGPQWIGTPFGFRAAAGRHFPLSLPLATTEATLDRSIHRSRDLADACRAPILLGNIASPLRLSGTLSETEWLNRYCDATGAGVIVDVTALALAALTHGFEPTSWVRDLAPQHIWQIHVGGYASDDDVRIGTRRLPLREAELESIDDVLSHAPVRAVILQCSAGMPPIDLWLDALDHLRRLT